MASTFQRADPRGVLLGLVAVVGAVLEGLAAASGSAYLVVIPLGVALAVACAALRPELALTLGVLGTLAAGEYSTVARAGHGMLLVGGLVAALTLVSDNNPRLPRLVWLPLLTIGWLALRLSMGGGFGAARPLLSCFAAVLLAALCLLRQRDWLTSLGCGFVVFVIVSSVLGDLDPTGQRFEGISGNPNRMVFALLVGIPVMVGLGLRSRSFALRLVMMAGVVGAVRLILISGSDQGTVGLALIAGLALLYLSRKADRVIVTVVLSLGAAVVLAYVFYANVMQALSPDVTSLSGRTATFQAGLDEFRQNLWVGSGEQHVTSQGVVDRSTHNSTIGIAASAGVVGGLLWVALMLQTLWFGLKRVRLGEFAAAAGITVVVSQLVQTVEAVPLTWVALMLAASPFVGQEAP